MRWTALLLSIALAVGALLVLYPATRRSLPSAEQIRGLALGAGDQRRVLQDQRRLEMAVRDALATVRADPIRRWLPGQDCKERDLSFLTPTGWVDVHLYCSSGFLFDTIPPNAWR